VAGDLRHCSATHQAAMVIGMRGEETNKDPATEWAIRISVAVVFVLTGVDKFLPNSSKYWIHVFGLIGLGDWFRYFTGIIEIVGGLLFLVPIATIAGAAILIVTMLGAMVVQAAVLKHPADSIFPALYGFGVVLAFGKVRRRSGRASNLPPSHLIQ